VTIVSGQVLGQEVAQDAADRNLAPRRVGLEIDLPWRGSQPRSIRITPLARSTSSTRSARSSPRLIERPETATRPFKSAAIRAYVMAPAGMRRDRPALGISIHGPVNVELDGKTTRTKFPAPTPKPF
jgi:hypothetical protein